MNTNNLIMLANLLEKKADPNHFSMAYFFCRGPDETVDTSAPSDVDDHSINECGTVACAMGHAPLIFPPRRGEDWVAYSERVFGLEQFEDEWNWCFDADWSLTDNTLSGAVKRIRWLVEKGLPHNFYEQINGEDPLCYTDR